MTLILELPYPPALNHLYRHVVIGRRAATLLSKEGREYRARVAAEVLMANAQHLFTGRLAVSIELYPPDRRRRDLDGAQKSLLDSLQHAGVFKDDEQIDDLRIVRCAVCRPNGKVIVAIRSESEAS